MALNERDFPDETLDELFTYHAPQEGDPERYERIREAAKSFARAIRDNSPPSRDRTIAIDTHVRAAVMFANAGVALEKARE